MPEADPQRTTALLLQLAGGDARAQDRLYSAIRGELHAAAAELMRKQEAGHTLQPTALVHEAWIRLVSGQPRAFENRRHLLGVAAKAMRSVLVDHVRAKHARKRGGDMEKRALDEAVHSLEAGGTDLLDLDEALAALQRDDPELARLVELRFFCGLTQQEVAAALDVSLSTVERMWRVARSRLHRSMGHPGEPDERLV